VMKMMVAIRIAIVVLLSLGSIRVDQGNRIILGKREVENRKANY